jgi:hypothetical protein
VDGLSFSTPDREGLREGNALKCGEEKSGRGCETLGGEGAFWTIDKQFYKRRNELEAYHESSACPNTTKLVNNLNNTMFF